MLVSSPQLTAYSRPRRSRQDPARCTNESGLQNLLRLVQHRAPYTEPVPSRLPSQERMRDGQRQRHDALLDNEDAYRTCRAQGLCEECVTQCSARVSIRAYTLVEATRGLRESRSPPQPPSPAPIKRRRPRQ
jgi:hypothetical protein